jgi:hypothetical protein
MNYRAALATVGLVWLPLASHAQALQVGVGVHMGNYPLAATQAAVDALNLDFRGDVPWKDVEVTPGSLQYPTANSPLHNLDLLASDAASRKRNPLLILAYGNRFYDDGGQVSSPNGITAFARYAAFTVAHFQGRVNEFEIWNEWNHGLGAAPNQKERGDASRYVELLQATYGRIKAANPGAIVIGGAVAGTDTKWIEQLAQAQGLQYLDGLSVHPYVHCNARRGPKPPEEVRISNLLWHPAMAGNIQRVSFDGSMSSPVGGTPEQAIAWLDEVRGLLDKYSPSRRIPIYVTEIGWPTSQGQCGMTEQTVAAYLQRFMLLAASRPWIAGVWWYDLFDDGADPTNRENRFGLQRQDLKTPKPAWQALSAIRDIMNGPHDVTMTVGTDSSIEIKGVASNNKSFYASWLPTDQFDASDKWAQGGTLARSGFRAAAAARPGDTGTITAVPTVLIQQ